MNKNLTEIVMVLDRSGSMWSCKSDAERGLNDFIREQQKADGQANFTLIRFNQYKDTPYQGVNIRHVGWVTLDPLGGTALLDALGYAIDATGERLRRLPEPQRPGLVVVVVITDGEENSSVEYSHERVKEMIRHQQEKYNWQFVYLGANHDAFKVAEKLNFNSGHTASNLPNRYIPAYEKTSGLVVTMRRLSSMGQNAAQATYSAEDRAAMNNITVDNTYKTTDNNLTVVK